MIQGISDNFDAHLNTQIGLKQTHSLATIITQFGNTEDGVSRKPIERLQKEQLSTITLEDIEVKIYRGEKKPSMQKEYSTVGVLPLKVFCHQVIIARRSKENDLNFIVPSLAKDDVPDYSGFNTKHSRSTGQSKKPKTNIRYRLLINKTPADRSTILTAMLHVETISQTAGQMYSVFTCDQQLYRITLDIIWENPECWRNFYPRIGGCIG